MARIRRYKQCARSTAIAAGDTYWSETHGAPIVKEFLADQKRIVEAIASTTALAETASAITAAIEAQFPGMLCSILLADDTGTHLTCLAADSFPPEYNEAINDVVIGPTAGSCGTAAHRRELVVVTDIANDPLWRDFRDIALRYDLRACWSYPILSRERLLGTFAMYFHECRAPTTEEVEALAGAASLTRIAIERKRNDEHLKLMHERFELLTRATNDVVWDWDFVANTLWWNHGFQTAFGYPPEEIEPGPESWYSRVHPDDMDRVINGIHAAIDGGQEIWSDEYRFKRRDGSDAYIFDRGFVIRDENGKAIRMLGSMLDISARKQADQALRESQRMLATLVRNFPGAVYRCRNDARWTTEFVSEGIEMLTGYPSGDFVGNAVRSFIDLIHPEDRAHTFSEAQAALAEGRTSHAVYRIRTAAGEDKWVWGQGTGVTDVNGVLQAIEGFVVDISDRKRAEEAMVQHAVRQEIVAAFGQFALVAREPDELMQRAVTDVARGLGVEHSRILEHEPNENFLLLRARTGWTNISAAARVANLREQQSLESYCLQSQQPIVTDNFDNETRFTRAQFEQDARISGAVAVIIHGNIAPYGVLSAHSAQPHLFSANEINFVQAIANVLAAAIRRQEAEQRLAQLAQFDSLTGLPNRNLFRDRLNQAVARAQRINQPVALLFLDLDQFKEVNDTLGHEAGDHVLKSVSTRLRHCLREGDTIARLGGDEFTVILEEINNFVQIQRITEKILHAFAQPVTVAGKEFVITVSMGVAIYPKDGIDGDALLKHADIAMYQAKTDGRNNVQMYAPTMSEAATDRVSLERSLRQAIDREEFVVHYQPIIDLRSGVIIGLEALLRWQHPEWGLVAPGRFIQHAEQTGLIVPIGEWVLHEVCVQSANWQRQGLVPVRIAVNLSARQFRKTGLIDAINHALTHTKLSGDLLGLEITESLLMENPQASSRLLDQIKTMGVHVALDDFGTGYSSFSYLRHFPLDVVKIDRSFVRDLTSDPDDAAIAIAMIELAHRLELQLTAEGVETPEQMSFLQTHGCDYAQGYLFSRPQPAHDLHQILKNGAVSLTNGQ